MGCATDVFFKQFLLTSFMYKVVNNILCYDEYRKLKTSYFEDLLVINYNNLVSKFMNTVFGRL